MKTKVEKYKKLEKKHLALRKETLKELKDLVKLVKFNEDGEYRFKKNDSFEDESGNLIVGITKDSVLFDTDGFGYNLETYKFKDANIKDLLHLLIIVE